jgi:hypothetical protein
MPIASALDEQGVVGLRRLGREDGAALDELGRDRVLEVETLLIARGRRHVDEHLCARRRSAR